MAEEPDAGESSTGEQPDETDADGDSVDSEVEPTVEPEVEPETTTDDPADGDDEADPADGDNEADPADGDTTDDDADEVSADADEGESGTDTTEESGDPIGAVTDATDPPAESAPGVAADREDAADAETSEGSDDDPADTDDDPIEEMPVDVDDDEPVEEGDIDPADVNHGVPPNAIGEGPLQPAEESHRPQESGPADDAAADDAAAATEPATQDGGTATTPTTGPAKDPDVTYPEGPPDDEEMPLADHVEEMVLRLAVVCGVATVVAGTVFFFEPVAEDMIMFIWNSVIPWDSPVPETVGGTAHPVHFVGEATVSSNPRVYGPLELKLTELKFASLVGFILALPVFVYETYRFMRPGLYPHERRYYLAAVPTSLVLAFVGVSFAYFVILPAIFAYFIRYSRAAGALAFALRSTFDLILVLMGYMALVFQIPLFIMLAIMMGLTDRQWLEDKRLYFWGGFLGVSFLFVPEPTGMAPILVALTMIGLYEGTLALLRWTGN